MIGLLALAHRLAPSLGWREGLDIGVLFFSYGLLALWLKINSAALNQEYTGRTQTRVTVIDPLLLSDDLPAQFYIYSDTTYNGNDLPPQAVFRNN